MFSSAIASKKTTPNRPKFNVEGVFEEKWFKCILDA
jgi:hypothetical protein